MFSGQCFKLTTILILEQHKTWKSIMTTNKGSPICRRKILHANIIMTQFVYIDYLMSNGIKLARYTKLN